MNMILQLTYYNELLDDIETFNIKYPVVDVVYWRRTYNCKNDNDVINRLNTLLKELDCSKIINYNPRTKINTPKYLDLLSEYFYYLVKLDNQIIYNQYIDKLLYRHIKNISFTSYSNDRPVVEKNTKYGNNKIVPNRYFMNKSIDMFTGEIIYFYYNPKTGDEIKSSSPNLLETLNKNIKPVKTNKVKKEQDTQPKPKKNKVKSFGNIKFIFKLK